MSWCSFSPTMKNIPISESSYKSSFEYLCADPTRSGATVLYTTFFLWATISFTFWKVSKSIMDIQPPFYSIQVSSGNTINVSVDFCVPSDRHLTLHCQGCGERGLWLLIHLSCSLTDTITCCLGFALLKICREIVRRKIVNPALLAILFWKEVNVNVSCWLLQSGCLGNKEFLEKAHDSLFISVDTPECMYVWVSVCVCAWERER